MAHHVRAHHNGTNADIFGAKIQGRAQSVTTKQGCVGKDQLRKCANPILKKPKAKSSGQKKKTSVTSKNNNTKEINENEGADNKLATGMVFDQMEATGTVVGHGTDLDAIFAEFGAQLKAVDMPEIETDEKILIMVSQILDKGKDELGELPLGRPLETNMGTEHVDNGLMFLAAGSDNATDADMESRALSDACFSTPGSKHAESPRF